MNRWHLDKATRDRIWTILVLLALAGAVIYSFVIQIIHHS